MVARVDGRPQAIELTPANTAMLWLTPPAQYQGRERVDILVELGGARTLKTLRVTGGAPVALTIRVSPGRVVADGRRGTELQVQAIDRNGTPTSVPGLSWETPRGGSAACGCRATASTWPSTCPSGRARPTAS